MIQVNVELPISIDRAVDLACHEGYPGHHVYNALLEQTLVRERGWIEFTVYPLFSPQSLIAEGTANAGIDIAFPGDEQTRFERDVLYPLAGLDPDTAEKYAAVQVEIEKLSYAGNEAARRYLNGEIDRAAAVAWLETWAADTERPRGTTHEILRPVPELRHQLQPWPGPRPRVPRTARRHGGSARRQVDGIRQAVVVAAAAVGAERGHVGLGSQMKAIHIPHPGPPDVLRLVERPDPERWSGRGANRRPRRRRQSSRPDATRGTLSTAERHDGHSGSRSRWQDSRVGSA